MHPGYAAMHCGYIGGNPHNFSDSTKALTRGYSDWIPLAKEILVENIPFVKENFLIMSPFLHDYKEFQPKYSILREIFQKQMPI